MAVGTGWNAFNTLSVIMTVLLDKKRYKGSGKLLKYNELYHIIVVFLYKSIW